MPTSQQRKYLRAAQKIYDRLSATKPTSIYPELVEMDWRRVSRQLRLLQLANQRHWSAAEKICRLRLDRSVQELRNNLERFLPDNRPTIRFVSVRELYQDLNSLAEEFEEVSIDLQEREIRVTTEPITLEEVELGPFTIILSWEMLPHSSRPYRIEAREPNPAATSDEITHPHVQEKTLCEGEARPLLENALPSGQLYEFFLIVAQTLRTYNPDSAFVSLSQWYGIPCHDCGFTVNEEDRIYCDHCESVLCGDCYARCTSCDQYCCAGCSVTCNSCDEPVCDSCRRECECCQQAYCERCLEDEYHRICETTTAATITHTPVAVHS